VGVFLIYTAFDLAINAAAGAAAAAAAGHAIGTPATADVLRLAALAGLTKSGMVSGLAILGWFYIDCLLFLLMAIVMNPFVLAQLLTITISAVVLGEGKTPGLLLINLSLLGRLADRFHSPQGVVHRSSCCRDPSSFPVVPPPRLYVQRYPFPSILQVLATSTDRDVSYVHEKGRHLICSASSSNASCLAAAVSRSLPFGPLRSYPSTAPALLYSLLSRVNTVRCSLSQALWWRRGNDLCGF
jgi:hypothetical protein